MPFKRRFREKYVGGVNSYAKVSLILMSLLYSQEQGQAAARPDTDIEAGTRQFLL